MKMETGKLNILIIEDSPSDAEFVRRELKKMGISSVDHVQNMETYREKFIPGKYDAILCDYNLGKNEGIEILAEVRKVDALVPFIIVSGTIGEEKAVEILKSGATDYVLKNNLGKLPPALSRALKEVEMEKAERDAFSSLEESERKYRSVVEDQTEYIFRWAPDGIIIFANTSYLKFHRMTEEEILGRNFFDLIPPGQQERIRKKVAGLSPVSPVSTDTHHSSDTVHGEYWHEWTDRAFFDEHGLVTFYQSVGRDISNQKKTEQELEQSEKYLSTLIESIPDLLFRVDAEGKILDYKSNDGKGKAADNSGSLIGHNFHKLIPKNIIELHKRCVVEALESKKIVSYDFEIRMPSEASRYYETRIKNHSVNEVILIVRDITKRKHAERELLKREELLSFSHKLSRTGYFTRNLHKNILFWSEELFRVFEKDINGYVPSFSSFLNLIHPEDVARVKEIITGAMQAAQSYTVDFRIITDGGTEKYLRETTEIQENESGEKIFIGVVQDITEIKDFENALLQRERQIKRSHKLNTQIIETSDQFFYVYKINFSEKKGSHVTYASPQVKDIFGVGPDEFISDNTIWSASIHPDDKLRAKAESRELYATKKPLTLIYRVRNSISGVYNWVEDHARPLLDSDGEIIELYGSVKNINERKKAEEELLKREGLLREAQRIAKLGTWEWNLNSGKFSLNDQMLSILEIAPENFGGKLENFLDFMSPESIPRFQESISNAYYDYKPEDIELKIITAKGNERKLIVRSSDHKETSVNTNVAHGTVLDITELWKSHEALFETEEKFKKIFETVTDIYYQTDLKGICTMVSPSCKETIGYSQEEMIGKQLAEIYEFPDQRRKLVNVLLKDGLVKNYEISLIAKNGNRVYVSANISLLFDQDGKPFGMQGIVRDISDKRKNEVEREKLLLELTNKYNQLMQFNYIVSHNLRSPITNLIGLSNMFEGQMTDEEQKTVISHIRSSVLSMDALVKDLNMILATRTAINENKEEILLTAIFETIRYNLYTEIADSKAVLITDVASDSDNLYTIKSYIQSILYNLVNNAIKYRASDRIPVIRISCKKDDDKMIISVADNGNGIDLSRFGKQLFGLYKRFDFSKEGRGLGLHMTKTQVEALGGEIKVESELGKGTTFTIILPN
ncbi:MAG TPA: PAS domain S-box protein [Bacteroidia bacterium]|nr:PAS domain S-box protein [Bacteroidia bacterium]